MSDLYLTADNATPVTVFCPKPNHIKPCWCRGVARCAAHVRKRWCKRIVKGSEVRCWQHGGEQL